MTRWSIPHWPILCELSFRKVVLWWLHSRRDCVFSFRWTNWHLFIAIQHFTAMHIHRLSCSSRGDHALSPWSTHLHIITLSHANYTIFFKLLLFFWTQFLFFSDFREAKSCTKIKFMQTLTNFWKWTNRGVRFLSKTTMQSLTLRFFFHFLFLFITLLLSNIRLFLSFWLFDFALQSEDDARRQRYMPIILANEEDNLKLFSKNNLVTSKIPSMCWQLDDTCFLHFQNVKWIQTIQPF